MCVIYRQDASLVGRSLNIGEKTLPGQWGESLCRASTVHDVFSVVFFV